MSSDLRQLVYMKDVHQETKYKLLTIIDGKNIAEDLINLEAELDENFQKHLSKHITRLEEQIKILTLENEKLKETEVIEMDKRTNE